MGPQVILTPKLLHIVFPQLSLDRCVTTAMRDAQT